MFIGLHIKNSITYFKKLKSGCSCINKTMILEQTIYEKKN